MSLLDAVEQTASMRAGGPTVEEPGTPPVQSEAELARQNERAIRELGAMMGGLGS